MKVIKSNAVLILNTLWPSPSNNSDNLFLGDIFLREAHRQRRFLRIFWFLSIYDLIRAICSDLSSISICMFWSKTKKYIYNIFKKLNFVSRPQPISSSSMETAFSPRLFWSPSIKKDKHYLKEYLFIFLRHFSLFNVDIV